LIANRSFYYSFAVEAKITDIKAQEICANEHCPSTFTNLPTFALDRLSRYEQLLWRQARQNVFALESLVSANEFLRASRNIRYRPFRQHGCHRPVSCIITNPDRPPKKWHARVGTGKRFIWTNAALVDLLFLNLPDEARRQTWLFTLSPVDVNI